MPVNRSRAKRRLGRCAWCKTLTPILVDYWREVKGRGQRVKLCIHCWDAEQRTDKTVLD